jgi:hypothetical protein
MSTIPASYSVESTPSVLSAGGAALDLNGLALTTNTRVPIGSVLSFASADAVASYFGSTSAEAIVAGGGQTLAGGPAGTGYFGGFENATATPGALLFAQYNTAAVGAYLRGGDISALTLAQLQALTGTLTVTIDAVVKTGSVDLSAATSFSNAAVIIADTLDIEGALAASFTGVISGTTLTASSVTGTPIAVGQIILGAGVTADTFITALGTGTGGAGTYTVNHSQSVSSEAMTSRSPGVSYDSVSGGFVVASNTTGASSTITVGSGAMATLLLLTAATGGHRFSPFSILTIPAMRTNWHLRHGPTARRRATSTWPGTPTSLQPKACRRREVSATSSRLRTIQAPARSMRHPTSTIPPSSRAPSPRSTSANRMAAFPLPTRRRPDLPRR